MALTKGLTKKFPTDEFARDKLFQSIGSNYNTKGHMDLLKVFLAFRCVASLSLSLNPQNCAVNPVCDL